MTLRKRQSKFVLMVGKLILWSYENGYELTFGEAYRADKKGHMPNSLHYERLAIDFNLFKDGRYLTDTEDHRPLGEYWESLGGAWGGRFGDGNHYSLPYDERR